MYSNSYNILGIVWDGESRQWETVGWIRGGSVRWVTGTV